MTIRSGKSYERQVMRHLSEERNRVVFELDARVPETTGRYERRIDVWLPQTREIIECKHFPNRSVGIDVIDRMVGTIQDVDAAGGHIFSSSGFTRQAQIRAQKAIIKYTTLPFKSRFETPFPPTGGGYFTGEYLDLCMARSQDCDTWGSISYADSQGNLYALCTGLSVDWGDAKMHGFVAYILLSHLLGRPPSDFAIDGFIREYGDRFEAGQEWTISESEAYSFAIAESVSDSGQVTAMTAHD